MSTVPDRRAFPRYMGHGIFVQVNSEVLRMLDISVAGIRVERPAHWTSVRNLRFVVLHGTDDGTVRTIPVSGHVVGDEETHLRIAFTTMPKDLVHLIDVFQKHIDPDPQDAGPDSLTYSRCIELVRQAV